MSGSEITRIGRQVLTLSTQLQNRTGTNAKCKIVENAHAKRAKRYFFIVNYANLVTVSLQLNTSTNHGGDVHVTNLHI